MPAGPTTIGDYALEVEPMREAGGQERGDELFTVKDSLFRLAEDIGLSYSTVRTARWAASRWPEDRRVSGVSFVHENVARVRATLDWIETAVDTGKVDVDGELAKLLQGE